jgi:hypothetical protein
MKHGKSFIGKANVSSICDNALSDIETILTEDIYIIYDDEYEYLHEFKKGIVRQYDIYDEDRDYEF